MHVFCEPVQKDKQKEVHVIKLTSLSFSIHSLKLIPDFESNSIM